MVSPLSGVMGSGIRQLSLKSAPRKSTSHANGGRCFEISEPRFNALETRVLDGWRVRRVCSGCSPSFPMGELTLPIILRSLAPSALDAGFSELRFPCAHVIRSRQIRPPGLLAGCPGPTPCPRAWRGSTIGSQRRALFDAVGCYKIRLSRTTVQHRAVSLEQ